MLTNRICRLTPSFDFLLEGFRDFDLRSLRKLSQLRFSRTSWQVVSLISYQLQENRAQAKAFFYLTQSSREESCRHIDIRITNT